MSSMALVDVSEQSAYVKRFKENFNLNYIKEIYKYWAMGFFQVMREAVKNIHWVDCKKFACCPLDEPSAPPITMNTLVWTPITF